jgi:GT2 family glycosyltransferase
LNEPSLKLAILLLNYNGLRYLPMFFEHAGFLKDYPGVDLVLIDNASIDDSLNWLKTNAPWVAVIRNDENFGFSEGYNEGIRKLRSLGRQYSHYMFLNNDVAINQEWLEKLLSAIRTSDKSVAEFGCRSVFMAPYIKETILTSGARNFESLACTFITNSASSQCIFDHKLGRLDIVGKIARLKNMVCQHEDSKDPFTAFYELELSTRSFSSADLIVAEGFSDDLRQKSPAVTEVSLWKEPRSKNQPPPKITVSPGRIIRIKRLVSTSELNTLPPLIQNSGIGINNKFEGHDLHCFSSIDTPQDHSATRGICGVCKIIRADVFEELGGFDKNMFMYYEDLDLSLRLQKKGYKSRLIEDAILVHDHSGTSNNQSYFFNRQVAWSLFYFHWRHGSLFRKLLTWIRFVLLAHSEKRSHLNPLRRPHELAVTKFKGLSNLHYLLGESK